MNVFPNWHPYFFMGPDTLYPVDGKTYGKSCTNMAYGCPPPPVPTNLRRFMLTPLDSTPFGGVANAYWVQDVQMLR